MADADTVVSVRKKLVEAWRDTITDPLTNDEHKAHTNGKNDDDDTLEKIIADALIACDSDISTLATALTNITNNIKNLKIKPLKKFILKKTKN